MARSTLALLVLLCLPAVVSAQADSTPTGIRFRMPGSTLPALRIPTAHQLANAALHPDPARVADAWRAGVTRGADSVQAARQEGALMRALYGQTQQQEAAGEGEQGLLGLGKQYVDLAIDGTAGLELRTDRFRNERCTPYQLQDPSSGCQGGFKAPRIDSEFMIRAAGVLGRRLFIDVDFDNKRDFDANNDIRIFYQGLQDEVVQRVEFGTVTFTPPASRFITAAIPAYSFGVNSQFEIGPVSLGALAASQKGSAVTERTYSIGSTTSQPQDRSLRDLDFEQGRFFWVVDPALLPGYPAVDILNLSASALPTSVRPDEVRIYRNRPTQGNGGNANLGGITAFAYRPDSPQRTGKLTWELLIEGQDYTLDPSGFWIAFANRLDAGDYLAVSYQTADGELVGTFPSTDDPAANDSLLLIVEPRSGANVPTFRHEMRQIYRVAGTDLTRQSLHVDVTLNRSESPATPGTSTFLAQLGLAIPTDPDVIDVDNRVYPRPRDPQALQVLRESYIVFPHLQPFADPTKLTAAERVDSLYHTPLYLLFTQGPPARFQFRLQYDAAGGGERNVIELNAFQIRDGSEQIMVGGRTLERGVDYSISYELGQVTFLDPDALFGNRQSTVTARFEERGIFAVAPTTIYGLTSTYKVGDAGTLNFIGIYQEENTVFSRPPVGFEPSANLVGGVTGDFRFRPTWATRLMDKLIVGNTEAPSALDVSGEFAFTAPQANRAGQAYLEEFEGEAGNQISVRENAWGFGSRPTSSDGLGAINGFAAGFDSADAVQLTWQNIYKFQGQPVLVRPQDIDTLIRITGGTQPVETVLYMTLHADTAGGFVDNGNNSHWTQPRRDFRPRWRSMVTSLSTTGVDLTQNEYLEFWLYQRSFNRADSAEMSMVIDLGTVGEDALSVAPESLTVSGADSTWTGRRYAGVGQLDTERQPTGYFNAATDDNGILIDRTDALVIDGTPQEDVATCKQVLSAAINIYTWGDLSVRCTHGNGTMDTEDLNGDNVLDANGSSDNVTRYVLDLRDPKYFVRNGGTGWRLYRVPLRDPTRTEIGTPNMRLVQHLRFTFVTPTDDGSDDRLGQFAFARMRFLGSPWVRRSDTPVFGLSGATAEPNGEVVVTTVSTENAELGYVPPPGVLEQAGRQDQVNGQQVNERSLRILGRDLQQGQRAEGYFRFVAGPQNLLRYRTLRLWVRGRGDGWNDNRLQAVFKVASDDRNFYAYRAQARNDTWEPEVVIELDTWRALRAEIEQRWLSGEAPSGSVACGAGDANAFVACQGPYLVQVADPGISPPNLAAVQEMDASIYYAGVGADFDEAELWVDDIRLVDPVNTIGTATALSARLAAADVADFSVAYVRQDGNFQQLGQDPTFLTTTMAQAAMSVRADRFLPTSLGVMLPISVTYTRSNTDPILVTGTDLRADDLVGLRKPSATQWAIGGSLRRSQRGRNWLVRGFLDPMSLTANVARGDGQTELSESRTRQYALGANYNLSLPRRGLKLPLDGLVDAMPKWMAESPLGTGMRGSILSLTPTAIRFTSGLNRNQLDFTTYSVAVSRDDDSLRTPTLNLSHFWRNTGALTFQPLGMLTLNGDISSTRDLRHYTDTTSIGRVVAGSREEFLGMDVGVERDRRVGSGLLLAPRLSTWLRPRWTRTSGFDLTRSLTSRDPVREDGDSGAFILPQTYSNSQVNEVGVGVDIDQLASRLIGDSNVVSRVLSRFRPVDLTARRSRFSTYDLATFDPSLSYVLAIGGREDFLVQEGERALGASEEEDLRITAGADLPGGIAVTLSYADLTTDRFIQLGEGFSTSESRQREWPQGTARMTRVMRSGPIATMGFGLVARRRDGAVVTPSSSGNSTSTTKTMSNLINPDVNFGLRSGLNIGLSWSRSIRSDQNSANTTEGNIDIFSANLLQSLRLPASISAARRPLRASVNATQTNTQTCLLLASKPQDGCKSVADTRRLSILGGLTTEVVQFAEAGLNVQYVSNEVRHLNQKTSQIAITMSLRMQFSSGDIR